MTNSLLSVLAGYVIFGLSAALFFQFSGVDPHSKVQLGFMIGSTLYGCAFAALSGFVASVIARENKFHHAIIVAVILVLIAIVSVFAAKGEHWSEIATIIFMAPCVLVGAKIQERF